MRQVIRIKYSGSSIFVVSISALLCLFGTTSALLKHIIPISALQFGLALLLIFLELLYGVVGSTKTRILNLLPFWLYMAAVPVLTAPYSGWGYLSTLFYIASLLMCFIISKKKDIVELILNIILSMCVFYAVTTIVFYFTPSFYLHNIVNLFPDNRERLIDMYNNGCMAGMTSHYSTNGNFLVIGLLLIVSKVKYKKSKLNILLIVLFVISLLMTGKRAQPIFGLLTIVVVYYITISVKDKNAVKRFFKILCFAAAGVGAGTILILTVPTFSTFVRRFQESADSGDVSSGRFTLWKLAFEGFASHPIFGIGWEMFKPLYSWQFSSERDYDVHNTYFQLLCEAGIVGFIIYMTWFILLITISIKQYKRLIKNSVHQTKDIYIMSFSLGYQMYFLIYCITGNPLYDRNMFFPYFLSCGIALYYHFHSGYLIRNSLLDLFKRKGNSLS